jgi:hypothetical protein
VLAECIKKGALDVVGSYYHLEMGKVTTLKSNWSLLGGYIARSPRLHSP